MSKKISKQLLHIAIFSSKLVNSVLAIIGGIVVSYLTIKVPFRGPALLLRDCRGLGGFPFSFTGKPQSSIDLLDPFCSPSIDYIALTLNVLVWFAATFYILSYLNKLLKKRLNKNNVEEE